MATSPNMCVFHHNMRTFSGGSVERQRGYELRYDALCHQKIKPIVIGFTEIRNDNHDEEMLALTKKVSGLSEMNCLTFWVRQTAAQHPQNEYTAIGWSPGDVKIFFCGICYYKKGGINDKMSERWFSRVMESNQAQQLRQPPDDGMADQQSVAFIAGSIERNKYIFAFVHNVYQVAERSTILNSLGVIMNNIFKKLVEKNFCQDQEEVRVVFGGDWNVDPANCRIGREGGILRACYAKQQKRSRDDEPIPTPTTLGGNCYDYWYINPALSEAYLSKRDPGCQVHDIVGGTADAMQGHASDHQAITINLPPKV